MVFASLLSQHDSYFAKKDRVPDRKRGSFTCASILLCFQAFQKNRNLALDNYETGDRFDKCKC